MRTYADSRKRRVIGLLGLAKLVNSNPPRLNFQRMGPRRSAPRAIRIGTSRGWAYRAFFIYKPAKPVEQCRATTHDRIASVQQYAPIASREHIIS